MGERGRLRLKMILSGESLKQVASTWLAKEPVKLTIAALAIALLQLLMAWLIPVLAAAQTYGDKRESFMNFRAFSKLCIGVTTCLGAVGTVTLVHRKARFTVKAPRFKYAIIATSAALAVAADDQLLKGVGKERDLSWQCFIVLVVMVLQKKMMRREFGTKDWLASTLFLGGCVLSALPWISAETAERPTPWYFVLGGTFMALTYLGMEGLHQTYQDKLFCDFGTTVSEQVLFISLFTSIIRLIGFLWEYRCLEVFGFYAEHPLSLVTVLFLSCIGAAMAFLMSYMLQLCGALICVMIHQIMVNLMEKRTQKYDTTNTAVKWVGTLVMFAMLAATMLKMQQHGNTNNDKIKSSQQLDVPMEELADISIQTEPLLHPPQQVLHVERSDETNV